MSVSEPSGGEAERRLRELAMLAVPTAQLVVDVGGRLLVANDAARAMFAIQPGDAGRLLRDLDVSYRPVELRSLIERAVESRAVVRAGATWPSSTPDRIEHLEVTVSPVIDADELLGTSITFADVTEPHTAHAELERMTRMHAEATGQLVAANEELATTNEELMASNEELESLNEELSATNEELSVMSDEFRSRASELDEANDFLNAIMASLPYAVIVLDRSYTVRAWNNAAAELWGPREDEAVGTGFFALDLLAPISQLREPLNAVLRGTSTRETRELDATNRIGRPVRLRVTITPFDGHNEVVMLMET